MKIIENPNPIKGKECTCPNCKCHFEYLASDVKHYHNNICGPGAFGYSWVNCPNCGESIKED